MSFYFYCRSNEINKYYTISNNTKLSIKIDLFVKIISSKHNNIYDYMKTILKTYNELKSFIIKSLKFEYNNDLIEGTNNLIKYIKKIAFEFKAFYHFKTKILLITGIYKFT